MSSITDLFSALQNGVKAVNGLKGTFDDVNTSLEAINTSLGAFTPNTLGVCGVQLLTVTGTYTPTSGTKTAIVIVQAAGGGGGGNGATAGQGEGGHGGAGETRIYALTGVTGTYSYTIGAVGAAPSAGNNPGGTASDTTFASLVTAKGGTGGSGSTGGTIAANGSTPTGSGGIVLPPTASPQSSFASGGPRGASTIFGMYNLAWINVANVALVSGTGTQDGLAGDGYGSGGTGSFKQAGAATGKGGAGAPGMILVIEFS